MNTSYHIYQFEDKCLAHYSYAIISEGKMAVIDPARDPRPYYDHAKRMNAQLVAVIETHPHADFVSSHLELATTTGATIYVSKLVGAGYEHTTFDDGDTLELGNVVLHSMNTPGHSPDSISILLTHEGVQKALFSGDTLFVGDVGRPDLREKAGNITAKREELAKMMYNTVQKRLKPLDDQVEVYPAHGAGSLCGKALSTEASTTIGAERMTNYAFKDLTEDEFVTELTSEQPHIPKYFGNSVALNRQGAPAFEASIQAVPRLGVLSESQVQTIANEGVLIVDTRSEVMFKSGHIKGALNIQNGGKFDTWLGTIVAATEPYYLVGANADELEHVIARTAAIGYESMIAGAFILKSDDASSELSRADLAALMDAPEAYTIVDVRNNSEAKERPMFPNAIVLPLPELRERLNEIPLDKPIMVHCAAGYRSAAGASIIVHELGDKVEVHDVGESIKEVPVVTV
jgi:glyoxylase-like metal-dependent hydrolase (beta-lactamase superfamily II)/rhodanese-related sulfurtransferase